MVDLDKVKILLEENYFILVLLFMCEIVALFFAARNLWSQYLGRLFIFYLSLDALTLFLDITIYATPTISNSFQVRLSHFLHLRSGLLLKVARIVH